MLGQRIVPPFVAGLLFLTVSALGQTTATPSPSIPPLSQFPPVGLAATETAQVNVFNTAPPSPAGGRAPVCSGTIAFYVGGSIVGTVTAFAVGGYYGTPKTFSAALPYASTGASGSRVVVLAVITPSIVTPPTDGSGVPPCALASSLETYDTVTGVTHAFVSGVAVQGSVAQGSADVTRPERLY
jgi:hypothetical protein